MGQEGVGVTVDRDLPRGHVSIHGALTLLPALRPEPALLSRYRQRRSELQHAVRPLGELNLGAGFVQMHPAPNLGRQSDDSAGLDPDVTVVRHGVILAGDRFAVEQQHRNGEVIEA